jgi:dolichol-phosphate mannosyltransferase
MTLAVRVSVLADQHASRFLRFCLVGGSGVVVNMGVLALLVSVGGWSPLLAAPVATEMAILNNFALNDRWTFGDRRGTNRWYGRLLRYNGITTGGLVISVATLAVLPRLLGLHYLVANLIAIGAGVVWNYSMNAWLTWMRNPSARHAPARITAS